MKKRTYIIGIFIVLGCLQIASATATQAAVMNAATATQTSTNENTQQKQINSIKRKSLKRNNQVNQSRELANRDRDKRRAWREGDLSPSQIKKLQSSRSR